MELSRAVSALDTSTLSDQRKAGRLPRFNQVDLNELSLHKIQKTLWMKKTWNT
jgi:hypothetical protein